MTETNCCYPAPLSIFTEVYWYSQVFHWMAA